jgi:hypothetical protein
MDISIFTGRVTLDRFKEERRAEYDRLVAEDKLDTVLTTPPTARARRISTIFGYIAYISGLLLIIAIFATLIMYKL